MPSKYKPKASSYWWIKYYENGKEIRYSLRTKDAKIAGYLVSKKNQELMEHRCPAVKINRSLQEIFDTWKASAGISKKAYVHERDCEIVDQFLKECGFCRVNDIDSEIISAYLKKRIKSGISPASVNKYFRNINAFLNWCVRLSYLTANPCRFIRPLPEGNNFPRFLKIEEFEYLLSGSQERDPGLWLMILTAIFTGMRLGEILRLRWGDIDFKNGILTVLESKSNRPRIIPLHKRLVGPLSEKYGRKDDLCFDTKNLRKRLNTAIQRAQEKASEDRIKINLSGAGWKVFRKTFGSQLAMAGTPLFKIQKWMGHEDPKITTKHYAHLLPQRDEDINRF